MKKTTLENKTIKIYKNIENLYKKNILNEKFKDIFILKLADFV